MSNASDPLVTIVHVRDLNLCVRGAKRWFEARHLDFNHFLLHGYPASVIEGTGDAFGIKVAAAAREEAADGEA